MTAKLSDAFWPSVSDRYMRSSPLRNDSRQNQQRVQYQSLGISRATGLNEIGPGGAVCTVRKRRVDSPFFRVRSISCAPGCSGITTVMGKRTKARARGGRVGAGQFRITQAGSSWVGSTFTLTWRALLASSTWPACSPGRRNEIVGVVRIQSARFLLHRDGTADERNAQRMVRLISNGSRK